MGQAYLELSDGTGRTTVPLDRDRLTVGRAGASDLPLAIDPAVSASHAVLERFADGWRISDTQSSGGTFVNGEQVTAPRLLHNGDTIVVGRTTLVFRSAAYLDLSEEWHAAPPPSGGPAGPPMAPPPRPAPPPPMSHPADPGVPAAPRSQPPAEAERRQRGQAHVRGVARDVQVRQVENRQSLTFRVDRYDAVGNRLSPVSVDLAYFVRGHIGEGDEVDVTGTWSRGILSAKKITNLSTHAQVQGPSTISKVVGIVAVTLVLAFICYIAVSGFFFS